MSGSGLSWSLLLLFCSVILLLLRGFWGSGNVVARGQPCLLVGDFNVEPTKIPCLAKGIMAGLSVDLEASWASASGWVPGFTCRQDWVSTLASRRDLMVDWFLHFSFESSESDRVFSYFT